MPGQHGVRTNELRTVALRDVVVRDFVNGLGARGLKLRLIRSTLRNNHSGASSSRGMTVEDSVIADNLAHGITQGCCGKASFPVTGSRIAANGHAIDGIVDINLELYDSTLSGNGVYGDRSRGEAVPMVDCQDPGSLQVKDSELTGNGTDVACSVMVSCADVAAWEEPKLSAVTGDTSYVVGSGLPGTSWFLCVLD